LPSLLITISVAILGGYLLGSIPSAYIIGRLFKKIDIREVGSKNMGAMNSFYNLGALPGALVLIMDIGKGALTVLFGYLLYPDLYMICFISAFMAVAGHNFPVWLGFRGGKGGAVVVGVCCALFPWAIIIAVIIFGVLTFITKWPTISYGIALITFPIMCLMTQGSTYLFWGLLFFVVIPYIFYVPRLVQVWKGYNGNIRKIFIRKNIKDRK